jgi:hypothetical protein
MGRKGGIYTFGNEEKVDRKGFWWKKINHYVQAWWGVVKQIYQVCSIGDMGLFDYTSWYMLMITVYYYKSEYVFDT